MAKFGKDNPPTGRTKGSVDRFTAFRRQLADLLPEARAALVDGVKAADPKMLDFFFRLTFTPLKSSYPLVAIDFDHPREALADIKAALRAGTISADHAAALLDVLERTNRLETAVALADATLVETSPLETAQAVIDTARQHGALDTVMEATRTALPYLVPHP